MDPEATKIEIELDDTVKDTWLVYWNEELDGRFPSKTAAMRYIINELITQIAVSDY